MSKPRFSAGWTFAFVGLVFTSTFISASFTGFHPFKRNCNQQQSALRPGFSEAHAAETEVEKHPSFQRGLVLTWINAPRSRLTRIWLAKVGGVRSLSDTRSFF
jgi:hypothetical protein